MQPRIMIIDDENSICISLSLALQPEFDVAFETDPRDGLERLRSESFDLVLLDLVIGEHDGLDILEKIKEIDPRLAVIMMTAYGSIHSSVRAMKRGAFTYLTKPLDLEELRIFILQALEFRALNDSVAFLTERLRDQAQTGELVGVSPAMQNVLKMIEKFRHVDTNILISGESGTGKAHVAQALHFQGKRKHFVWINCSALDEKRAEEEFFGVASPTRTSSAHDQRGKLAYADQGTLYLESVGDLPLSFQAKLLRVLQEKSYTPVGGHELRHFDTRVIASTNRDLRELVAQRLFREELLYRLNAVEIDLPPLRKRREDIPILSTYFVNNSITLRSKLIKVTGITEAAQALLNQHHYPGNVRELANAIDYAGIVASDEWIRPDDLPIRFFDQDAPGDATEKLLAGMTLQELERTAILASFQRNDGKRKTIAAELGISERGLWNKLKEYGLV